VGGDSGAGGRSISASIRVVLDILESQRPPARAIISDLDRRHDDEEFGRRLASVPEEEVDEETVAPILAAETEQGKNISHGELKQRLGL
jgi:hypothetical protein